MTESGIPREGPPEAPREAPPPPREGPPGATREFPGKSLLKRRWVTVAIGAVVILGGFFLIARSRQRPNLTPRLVPLAAELEGIRGVYLYFGANGSDSLVAEYRDVVVKDRPAEQVRAIYRELLAGSLKGNVSLFPDGTELLETYWTERGTLYLDWNRAITQGFRGGSERERQLLASIARTAGENLPGIQRVVLLVEGDPTETIGGHFDAMMPLEVRDWR